MQIAKYKRNRSWEKLTLLVNYYWSLGNIRYKIKSSRGRFLDTKVLIEEEDFDIVRGSISVDTEIGLKITAYKSLS